MLDADPLDTTADILTEKFAHLGMTARLAGGLVAAYGEDVFDGAGGADSVARLKLLEMTDTLRLLAYRTWESKKPRKTVGCFLLALGFFPHGITSQRDLAKHFKVSPEDISNGVEEWQYLLKLPKTPHQKSEQAVQAARFTHRTNRRKGV